MNLIINGLDHEHRGTATVQALLDEMGINSGRVAVMVNDKVIRRGTFPDQPLHDADRVELLTFAGGG